jgi:hypothetical protein
MLRTTRGTRLRGCVVVHGRADGGCLAAAVVADLERRLLAIGLADRAGGHGRFGVGVDERFDDVEDCVFGGWRLAANVSAAGGGA